MGVLHLFLGGCLRLVSFVQGVGRSVAWMIPLQAARQTLPALPLSSDRGGVLCYVMAVSPQVFLPSGTVAALEIRLGTNFYFATIIVVAAAVHSGGCFAVCRVANDSSFCRPSKAAAPSAEANLLLILVRS